MDELEISGKRYISARRAGKEYKYHSDYIGQLIRGKKLLGRKVGRSWYVELDSTAAYFGGEGVSIPKAELVAKAVAEKPRAIVREVVVEEVADMAAVEAPQEFVAPRIQQTVNRFPEERIKVNKAFSVEETLRESVHIPVRVQRPSFVDAPASTRSSLMYVSDDEPYIPMTRQSKTTLAVSTVMPRNEEEVEEVEEVEETESYTQSHYSEPQRKSRIIVPALRVLVLGAVVFAIVMSSSVFVSSYTVVEAGKTAGVGYSVK